MKQFDIKSIILGMVLCAMLFVFLGSKTAEPQVVTQASSQARVLQRAANTDDIYDKTVVMGEKLDAMDKQLNRMERKLDDLVKDMNVVIKVMWADLKK